MDQQISPPEQLLIDTLLWLQEQHRYKGRSYETLIKEKLERLTKN